jgi:predicted dehydrogenase
VLGYLESSDSVLLVGAGKMAEEYAAVLLDMKVAFQVIGRSEQSCDRFFMKTGIRPYSNGLQNNLPILEQSKTAIVAVSMEELYPVTISLLESGYRRILVEKPAAMTGQELENLSQLAYEKESRLYVAYNRRFYQSVQIVKKAIEEEELTSFHFEFTEWSHIIKDSQKPADILQKWFFGNSTHVIDLAFFLGGAPLELTSYVSGSLDWHSAAARFSGSGISSGGAIFSYFADWTAPGRWGVELCTRKSRYILRPLEAILVQKLGSIQIAPLPIDNDIDGRFKPGLWLQTQAFLNNETEHLLTIVEHKQLTQEWYSKILQSTI